MRDGHRILLVEDNTDAAEALGTLLESVGFDVVRAPDGERALAILHRDPSFCVILLDLMMPGMDGYQFRAVQSADERLAEIPVVVLSATGNVRANAKRLGVRDFLEKPLDPDAVLAAVWSHCDPSR